MLVKIRFTFSLLLAPSLLLGCGGSAPATRSATAIANASPPSDPAPASLAATSAGAPAAAPKADDNDDPSESATAITMEVELSKPFTKSTFPKKTSDEGTCWQTMQLTGDAKKDFDTLASACGTPTGLREYAKPVSGHLHHQRDKRDTFSLKLAKGLCYRYMAVADNGIHDLDILVEKPSGALVADDKQMSPVAIIQAEKTWCMDDDAEYDFHIEVDGVGAGKYVFGVWAKPKGSL
jgi:hypothetical protein